MTPTLFKDFYNNIHNNIYSGMQFCIMYVNKWLKIKIEKAVLITGS